MKGIQLFRDVAHLSYGIGIAVVQAITASGC